MRSVTSSPVLQRSPTARDLWAKLARGPDSAIVRWHSLVDHSADVAAVMLELLAQRTIDQRLARLAQRETLHPIDRARLGALAFLHDIGKANRGFRSRLDASARVVGHIDELGWMFSPAPGARACRDRLVEVLGLDRLETWFADENTALFETLFAHHGRPWRLRSETNGAVYWRTAADGDPIGDLQAMRDALDRWFGEAFAPHDPLPSQPGFHHAYAGLMMLADWLGSDASEAFFPFANGSEPDRMTFARVRAAHAIRTVGLQSASPDARGSTNTITFATAFEVTEARPVQAVVTAPDAACLVLEAETGSGKTEAALWRFKHLFAQGRVDGLYFALPTRVAATAMFARVRAFRDRLFGEAGPPVVLAVPGQVVFDDAEGRPLPGFGFEWSDAHDNGVDRSRWAAEHPKRFLAAPIAVGTIDQALLGAIRVKHAHLRGASLLRHLLVVDEVHASDRYMEALLASLLRNHLGGGGHALLLSATLGAAARARLLGTCRPTAEEAEAVPYPLLSWADGRIERRLEPERVATVLPKRVALITEKSLDRPDEIARQALVAASAGAAVLVIRNTVAAAVATVRALEVAAPAHPALFRVGDVVTVHHGRFAALDRRTLDAAVEHSLGRDRTKGGRVVVGTQTLEVSLDLDADLLITDLCPADVLLQRLGRLHRHRARPRPSGFEQPRAIVLVPAGRDLLPFAARSGGRHGLGRVYDDLAVIEATWRQIEASVAWTIPADNRRLVERTTHPECLSLIKAELEARDPGQWSRHMQEKEGKTASELNEAEWALVDWRTPFAEFSIDADEHFRTRLGEADRQVELSWVNGPFGLPVTSLRIPHFLLSDADANAESEPTDATSADGAIRFHLGSLAFRYDRFGLDRVP